MSNLSFKRLIKSREELSKSVNILRLRKATKSINEIEAEIEKNQDGQAFLVEEIRESPCYMKSIKDGNKITMNNNNNTRSL